VQGLHHTTLKSAKSVQQNQCGILLKLCRTEILVDRGGFSASDDWISIRTEIEKAIEAMEWPPGSGKFTLYDDTGKGRGRGNGVKPIKEMFVRKLREQGHGWEPEVRLEIPARVSPGPIDVMRKVGSKRFAVEWETGNISSSHRAMNKLAMGLLKGVLIGGALIMPTRRMYTYLTDRVGNFEELSPYFDAWKSLSIIEGLLAVIAVEHDEVSKDVPRFEKGTNGRHIQ
jgi:hypothetical protein